MGFCVCSAFYCAVRYALSALVIILIEKRELVALRCLSGVL